MHILRMLLCLYVYVYTYLSLYKKEMLCIHTCTCREVFSTALIPTSQLRESAGYSIFLASAVAIHSHTYSFLSRGYYFTYPTGDLSCPEVRTYMSINLLYMYVYADTVCYLLWPVSFVRGSGWDTNSTLITLASPSLPYSRCLQEKDGKSKYISLPLCLYMHIRWQILWHKLTMCLV